MAKKTIYNNEDKANAFLIGIRWPNGIKCPYCDCSSIYSHKESDRRDRLQCYDCKKSFTVLTKTFLAGCKNKAKWLLFIKAYLDSEKIKGYQPELNGCKAMAKKLDISLQSFNRMEDRLYKARCKHGKFLTAERGDKFLKAIMHELHYIDYLTIGN